MPEDSQQRELGARHKAAVEAVAGWLSRLPCGVRPLNAGELHLYYSRDPVCAWRLDVDFGSRSRRLDLILPGDFPRLPPKVALVDRPEFLTWPHVEEDGVLCLLPDS